MAEINDLSITAASNVDRFPENMAPSAVNNSARELEAILARGLKDTIDGAITTTGTSTAYLAAANRTLTAYYTGLMLCVKWHTASGATPTINVDSIGAKNLVWPDGTQVAASELPQDALSFLMYDGTSMQVLTVTGVPFTDPLTTRGDILVRNSSNVSARLAIGAADTAPVSDGTDVAYTGITKQGAHTAWIPAQAFTARTTNGAAAGTTELATNDIMLSTFDFDQSTEEGVQFMLGMPKSWNESTLTVIPYWTAASGTGDVIWQAKLLSLSNDDAMDAALGSAQTSTDTLITANDLHIGPTTSAITAAGTPAENDLLVLEITRKAADIGDTLNADAKLIGVKLIYTTNAGNDA